MKLFFLPFLALMLCNFCSSTPSGKANKESIASELLLMGILKIWGIENVKGETIPDYHIILDLKENDEKISKFKPCILDRVEKSLTFYDVGTFSKIMPEYGALIRKLSFKDPIDSKSIEDWAKAHHIVNEHCSKSLHEFDMGGISDEKLKNIPMKNLKKFENVKILKFSIEGEINKHKLSDLFPGVAYMDIHLLADADYPFIDCKLKDLERVNFKYSPGVDRAGPIIRLIKENKQIQVFNIDDDGDDDTSKIRKAISEHSENLKELHICSYDESDEPCNFKSVTKAILDVGPLFHIDSLSFPKLNSLEINYHPEKRDAFHRFFVKHQNLKELTFKSRITDGHISTSAFEQFTDGLLKLETVTARKISKKGYDEKDLYKFISGHLNLKKFIFPVYDKVNITDFRKEIGGTWTIKENGKTHLLLERASNP